MQSACRSALLLVLVVLAAACGPAPEAGGTAVASSPATPSPGEPAATTEPSAQATDAALAQAVPEGSRLAVRVTGERPHDETAFTQGLEFHEGRLFESRGLYAGQEATILTEVDPADGSTIRSLGRTEGDPDHFYEGLTVVGDRIIQLTWQDGIAYAYDRDTFERTGQFAHEGEGWGICDEPDRLVMSNGTPELTLRDLDTFEVLDTVTVTLDGQPVDELNELECVGGLVWANVWRTPTIVVIQPDTGEVVSVVDASAIAGPGGRSVEDPQADVLNGIAFDDQTSTWLLTGKLWPTMYEVAFDCVEGCDGAVTPSHYQRPDDPPPARETDVLPPARPAAARRLISGLPRTLIPALEIPHGPALRG